MVNVCIAVFLSRKKINVIEIKFTEITIKDLFDGYENNDELGVKGYGGKLDIRPPYQREFIYNPEQQRAVMQTVVKNFPLNVMY